VRQLSFCVDAQSRAWERSIALISAFTAAGASGSGCDDLTAVVDALSPYARRGRLGARYDKGSRRMVPTVLGDGHSGVVSLVHSAYGRVSSRCVRRNIAVHCPVLPTSTPEATTVEALVGSTMANASRSAKAPGRVRTGRDRRGPSPALNSKPPFPAGGAQGGN
jgi:hypothetical protein